MHKLIINADDFGYSRAVNYGIVDAHRLGVLTSTTMMTNMPGTNHAAQLAKENPDLGVGVHLVLTCGRPLLDGHRTLVDVDGNFRKLAFYKGTFNIDLDELYREWKAQIEKFLSLGLEPTHLDSHHHINSYGQNYTVFLELAKEYNLPVRNNMDEAVFKDYPSIKTTDYFEKSIGLSLKDMDYLLEVFKKYHSIEIMTHPAYLDKLIMTNSSYTYPRLEELELLTDPRLKESLEKLGDIELATFRDI